MNIDQPEPFLNIRVHDLGAVPSLSGLCVGFERGEWRESDFVDHVMEWLPEFALKESEFQDIGAGKLLQLIRKAASTIYKSEKFKNRGEFGEVFLHIVLRQVFNSLPVVSKIYYKSSNNDTVKGFDSVHVIENGGELELWIGEVKFYEQIDIAIRDVVKEINEHTTTDYLRDEFTLIVNKIDTNHKHYTTLKKLLSRNTSLDEIFERACIPVLLTYESETINSYTSCSKEYKTNFEKEVRAAHAKFSNKKLPLEIRIHLFLLPIKSKISLVTKLDSKLKTWQKI